MMVLLVSVMVWLQAEAAALQKTPEQSQPQQPPPAAPSSTAPQEQSQPQQPQPAQPAPPAVSAPVQQPQQAAPTIPSTPTLAQPGIAPQTADDEILFMAVGDVMLGTTYPDAAGGDLPPNDGADILHEVAPILKNGDVTFGNLEGPLVDGGVSAKCHGKKEGTCYAFRVPTRYGKYLKAAGFNVMGLANNHAMDFGAEGRES